jgi:hypothetical protein
MALRGALITAVALGACHGAAESLLDAALDASATDARAIDAPALLDPWTAPTGAPIAGATLADGWTDLRALPAPLAIQGGWTDSLFAQTEGLHLRFGYEPADFYQFYKSQTQVITGPELLGETGDTFQLFDATLTTTGWTIAIDPVGTPGFVEASPATNASGDLLVFTRFELPSGHAVLYFSSFVNNAWTAPAPLAINSGSCNTDNAKLVGELATGVTVYFESNRGNADGTATTCGQRTVYMTTLTGGSVSPVVPIPGIATADSDDTQPFTADQDTLYWASQRAGTYGLYTATHQLNGLYGNVHQIITPTLAPPVSGKLVFIGEASIVETPEGSLLYLMCGVAYNEQGGATYFDADNIRLQPCVARRPNVRPS